MFSMKPYDWNDDPEMVLDYVEATRTARKLTPKATKPRYECLCGSHCRAGHCINVPC